MPTRIDSEYLSGDFRCFEGEWRFDPLGDGLTRVQVEIRIDPGFPIPGRIVKMLNERVLKSSIDDRCRRLEGG